MSVWSVGNNLQTEFSGQGENILIIAGILAPYHLWPHKRIVVGVVCVRISIQLYFQNQKCY